MLDTKKVEVKILNLKVSYNTDAKGIKGSCSSPNSYVEAVIPSELGLWGIIMVILSHEEDYSPYKKRRHVTSLSLSHVRIW